MVAPKRRRYDSGVLPGLPVLTGDKTTSHERDADVELTSSEVAALRQRAPLLAFPATEDRG